MMWANRLADDSQIQHIVDAAKLKLFITNLYDLSTNLCDLCLWDIVDLPIQVNPW